MTTLSFAHGKIFPLTLLKGTDQFSPVAYKLDELAKHYLSIRTNKQCEAVALSELRARRRVNNNLSTRASQPGKLQKRNEMDNLKYRDAVKIEKNCAETLSILFS